MDVIGPDDQANSFNQCSVYLLLPQSPPRMHAEPARQIMYIIGIRMDHTHTAGTH